MLLELRIEHFAVIDRVSVRLAPGLNVLSGETGAGKSIIVGALGLLLGERASSEVVRPGADRAVVEGVFDVSDRPRVLALLEEQGIEAEEGLLILRREVALEGRNRAWINGAASTAGLVGRLGGMLVDLHGQHEHQTLLRADEQRGILDAYAGAADLAGDVAAAHEAWRRAGQDLADLDRRRQEVAQRADFLRFQLEEIEGARLEPAEEERIEEEANRLEHAEELAGLAGALHETLYAGEDALSERLAAARRELDRLLRIDGSESELRALMDSAYFAVEEAGRRLGDYAAGVEHDPARLRTLRARQDLLFRLFRKYGEGSAAVLEAGRRAREELDVLEGGSLTRKELEARVEAAAERLSELAGRLSEARRGAADRLAAEVDAILPELGLDDGRFRVELEALEQPGATGGESVEFRVALNRGFEPRPLARVASGGELSRVMLALKTVLARVDAVPSLVFDEIDAGIGGRTANKVGETLRDVAGEHQVFAITHLAQIAARADHHLRVEKSDEGGAASTRVVPLEGEARVAELVRMMGGDPGSEVSVRHARELLEVGP